MIQPASNWATGTRTRRFAFQTAPQPPPLDHGMYVPSTWPGARAPHVWLRDGRSTLDLFGKGFTLIESVRQRQHDYPDGGREPVSLAACNAQDRRTQGARYL